VGQVAGTCVTGDERRDGSVRDVLRRRFAEEVVGHGVAEDTAAFVEIETGLFGDLGVRGGAVEGDTLSDVVVVYRLQGPGVVHLLSMSE